MLTRYRIQVEGIVQGVGFRPFIYKIARKINLSGFVLNTSDMVIIEVEGELSHIDEFLKSMVSELPFAASIKKINKEEIVIKNETSFKIIESINKDPVNVYIPSDLSICDDCLKELFDKKDKRYLYPFINCTNCGPRYSIIEALPYDRKKTTMRDFQMCEKCLSEYKNPDNRRYHAEPNACDICGPEIMLLDSNGIENSKNLNALKHTVDYLHAGKILAIKGIGGFHLAVDAYNDESVKELRLRKKRGNEPFAVMVSDINEIERITYINEFERKALLSKERPIVILNIKKSYDLSQQIASGLNRVGIMLPYTPLHFMLFDQLKIKTLVMTSGNYHDEPIVSDNIDAVEKLKGIADYFLVNNRDIRRKIDDSVMFYVGGKRIFTRRSRGFIPNPIEVDVNTGLGVAFGAETKNTISLSKANLLYPSQHIGDLKNKDTYEYMKWVYLDLCKLLSIKPTYVVCDMHPDYFSTIFAEGLNLPLIRIQHHKAHIAKVIGSMKIKREKILGIVFDGTGFGEDKNSWGGEFFICVDNNYKRVGHFEYFPLPGGDKSASEIWRIGYSLLLLSDKKYIEKLDIDSKKIEIINKMIQKGLNTPLTSSVGRLFDGISSILNICQNATFEGEGAMLLESKANKEELSYYSPIFDQNNEKIIIILKPLIDEIITDLNNKIPIDKISSKFHNYLVEVILRFSIMMRERYSINDVLLSGGVFQNFLLLKRTIELLKKNNFEVIVPDEVPINDGGISFGQLYLASIIRRESNCV